MDIPKNLKPRWTTIVMPTEYDIEKEIISVVRSSSQAEGRGRVFVIADIGKLVGLYIAYLEACDEILALKIEADQNSEFSHNVR